MEKSDADWKKDLTPEQYGVLRKRGTERAFSGQYWDFWDNGEYHCAACGAKLFVAGTKFDAGCGWPSFTEAVNNESIESVPDNSLGLRRTEVRCRNCHGHLGHVFNDGPKETGGLRYCINSASLKFQKK